MKWIKLKPTADNNIETPTKGDLSLYANEDGLVSTKNDQGVNLPINGIISSNLKVEKTITNSQLWELAAIAGQGYGDAYKLGGAAIQIIPAPEFNQLILVDESTFFLENTSGNSVTYPFTPQFSINYFDEYQRLDFDNGYGGGAKIPEQTYGKGFQAAFDSDKSISEVLDLQGFEHSTRHYFGKDKGILSGNSNYLAPVGCGLWFDSNTADPTPLGDFNAQEGNVLKIILKYSILEINISNIQHIPKISAI
jgi:hypothetical protein